MILTACLMAAALATSGCERVSDAAFGARVKSYLLEHPEVIEEAVTKLEEKKAEAAEAEAAEAQKSAAASLPKYRAALERDARDYVANPNGKITVTEFFDYHCGYCRRAAPEVIKLIAENPDVRFVFKEFPILSEDSHTAAALAIAAQKQGKYLSVHQGFYGPGRLTPEAMTVAIVQAGLNPDAIHKAAKDPAVLRHIDDNRKLAQALRIDGTPSFIVGDAIIAGADMDRLKFEIVKARAEAK